MPPVSRRRRLGHGRGLLDGAGRAAAGPTPERLRPVAGTACRRPPRPGGRAAAPGLRAARRGPQPQHDDGGDQAQQRGDDVGELDRDEVRRDELGDRERDAGASATGQVCLSPRAPSTSRTSSSGTKSASSGVCRPTYGADLVVVDAGQVPAVMIGDADRAERDGRGVRQQHHAAARIGEKPSAMSMTPVIATGAPNPARASIRPPKQNAMMMRLEARVVGDAAERRAQVLEPAADHRQLVEPDRGEDDPHDREQAEDGALGRGQQREPDRHPVRGDGDDDRDGDARRARPSAP